MLNGGSQWEAIEATELLEALDTITTQAARITTLEDENALLKTLVAGADTRLGGTEWRDPVNVREVLGLTEDTS